MNIKLKIESLQILIPENSSGVSQLSRAHSFVADRTPSPCYSK